MAVPNKNAEEVSAVRAVSNDKQTPSKSPKPWKVVVKRCNCNRHRCDRPGKPARPQNPQPYPHNKRPKKPLAQPAGASAGSEGKPEIVIVPTAGEKVSAGSPLVGENPSTESDRKEPSETGDKPVAEEKNEREPLGTESAVSVTDVKEPPRSGEETTESGERVALLVELSALKLPENGSESDVKTGENVNGGDSSQSVIASDSRDERKTVDATDSVVSASDVEESDAASKAALENEVEAVEKPIGTNSESTDPSQTASDAESDDKTATDHPQLSESLEKLIASTINTSESPKISESPEPKESSLEKAT